MPNRKQIIEAVRLARDAATRYWRRGAIVFALGAVVAFVGTLMMPRTYYSEARLFVRFGRENQVDPTASGGQMVALYESRESEINSLIEILRSRAILDRVVAELGPDFVLSGRPGVRSQEPGARSQGGVPSRAHQMAVLRLSKDLSIGAPRKSIIITVACKAPSPHVAQQIVAKLVAVYQEEHVRVHRSPGSYEFFQTQAEQSRTAWQAAAGELRAMKDALGIVTVDGRRKKLEDQIADIDAKRMANESELKTSAAKIASLESLIAALPATIVTQEVESPNAVFDGMRQTLYALESQEVDLATRMQEEHPKLIALRQQVNDLRNILANQPEEKYQQTEALNPARQGLETALLTEKSQAEALAAREKALVAAQQQLDRELTALNGQAGTIDELSQRVALAEGNHKEYSQRLEQARINRKLDEERISSLSLVQPASFAATPAGPRRILVLAMGMFVAAISGIGVVAISAWFNPILNTPQQIAELIDLPLTGIVPLPEMATAA